ncbi:glutathione S-transferase THETA 2 [Striga asiatica]|uniref:Glutathione S-transferase THETA 2 n=1 Tax=Striga asiatica TaxID=4170 RepID=A0A5A7Q551_STRAF|nr:glutathione S-transferase THETA 2 [Striga asiatica]
MGSQDLSQSSSLQQSFVDPNLQSQFTNVNQSSHPNFLYVPLNASYNPFVNQQPGNHSSFQGLLNSHNIPFDNIKNSARSYCVNDNGSNTQKPNISQASVANKNWTKAEDIALTKAWLYVSIDSDVGSNQKNTQMWNRILMHWKENMGVQMWNRILMHWKENMGVSCNSSRNTNSLGCRWAKIQSAVSKYHEIYECLERIPQSGSNIDDLKREAMRAYEDINNKKEFKFEHCWNIMRKNPKWCTNQLAKTNGTNKSKGDNTSHLSTDSPSINLCDDTTVDPFGCEKLKTDGLARPEGRKACKDKKRKSNDEKWVVEVLGKLQCTLEMHVAITREELELKKEKEKKEHDLREQVIKKEFKMKQKAQRLKKKDQEMKERVIEMKENAQRLKIKDQELKEKAQRRHDQEFIMNQDVTKLSPTMRETIEIYRVQILKEWENECCISNINQTTSSGS